MYQATEEEEQTAVFEWAQVMAGRFPELLLLFHIPNGGTRRITEAVRFKKAGVKAGVPDLFLPVARGGCHGLFVEMKRRKGGRVSPEQDAWIGALGQQGFMCVVAHGAEEACGFIEGYLEMERTEDRGVRIKDQGDSCGREKAYVPEGTVP